MRVLITSILVLLLGLSSCSGGQEKNGKTFLPTVTGRNGEVLVVMNDAIKTDTCGAYIRAMLADDFVGLSTPEPIFDMQSIPAKYMTAEMKTFRNILYVEMSDTIKTEGVRFYNDYWATPQAFISVRAKNKTSLLSLLEENHIKIVSFLVKSERDRLIAFNRKAGSNSLGNDIKERYGISLVIPNTFSKCNPKNAEDMSWIQIDTDESQCGMFVYSYDYTSEECFTKEYILNHRDKLLRDNVEGPNGSYMCTEIRFGLDEITYKAGEYNNMYVAEIRGLWRMEGYAMGGPFILRAHLDQAANKVIVTDGYVYYPSKERKRNLIRQLEAVMYSLDFVKEETK